jgi:hypothetical protein
MVSLLSRISQLEKRIGTKHSPRQIMIWCGPHYEESWIECGGGWDGNSLSLYVKTPDTEVDPLDFLTTEQRDEIRAMDSVVVIWTIDNGRDAHLELNKPPWKRKSRNFTYDGGEREQSTDDHTGPIKESPDRLIASLRLAPTFTR